MSDRQTREALKWALDEIDVLSNMLVKWAYPQGMAMVGREDQFDNYRAACEARKQGADGFTCDDDPNPPVAERSAARSEHEKAVDAVALVLKNAVPGWNDAQVAHDCVRAARSEHMEGSALRIALSKPVNHN